MIIDRILFINFLFLTERPEIEENDESCVVRIAPKSIKLKIKPLAKPEGDTAMEENDEDVKKVGRERSLSPVTNMHPKKKLAHMTDSIVNNFPVVNNLIHSTLPYINHPTENLNNHHKPTPQNILATRNGIDNNDDYEFKDEDANIAVFTKPSPVKPKKSNNENSVVKKGRDIRTKCDKCSGDGSNSNLVRYRNIIA